MPTALTLAKIIIVVVVPSSLGVTAYDDFPIIATTCHRRSDLGGQTRLYSMCLGQSLMPRSSDTFHSH